MANFPGEFILLIFGEDAMDGEVIGLILDGEIEAERLRLCDPGP